MTLASANVRKSERVIIFGDTEDHDHMVTLNAKFTVDEDATLTIKNMKIDAHSGSASQDAEARVPALDVNLNASVTVENCEILSNPAIRLPSGDFSIKATTLYPYPTPVTWSSGSGSKPIMRSNGSGRCTSAMPAHVIQALVQKVREWHFLSGCHIFSRQ